MKKNKKHSLLEHSMMLGIVTDKPVFGKIKEDDKNFQSTLDLDKEIDNWFKINQKKYDEFLNTLLLGKNIVAKAMVWKDNKGHSWTECTIMNIIEIKTEGGYFSSEVSVKDEKGKYFTLLRDSIIKIIK